MPNALEIDTQIAERLLHHAIATNDETSFELVLQIKGLDVNCVDRRDASTGPTALHAAIAAGRANLVARLLAHPEIDVNLVSGNFYETPLYVAHTRVCHCKDKPDAPAAIDILAQVLGHPNLTPPHPKHMLHVAAEQGLASIITLIRKHTNIDPNKGFGEYQIAALYFAAREGYLNAVNALLEFSAIDINHRDRRGKSALDIAVEMKHWHIAERLVNVGAVPDIAMLTQSHNTLKYKQFQLAASNRRLEAWKQAGKPLAIMPYRPRV